MDFLNSIEDVSRDLHAAVSVLNTELESRINAYSGTPQQGKRDIIDTIYNAMGSCNLAIVAVDRVKAALAKESD